MDGGIEAKLVKDVRTDAPGLPGYLVRTYWWAYLTPTSVLLLDNPVVLTTILWGNLPRLIRTACDEFQPGQRVLQAASAYGNLSPELAAQVGPNGRLEVIDIAPLQVAHVQRKLKEFPARASAGCRRHGAWRRHLRRSLLLLSAARSSRCGKTGGGQRITCRGRTRQQGGVHRLSSCRAMAPATRSDGLGLPLAGTVRLWIGRSRNRRIRRGAGRFHLEQGNLLWRPLPEGSGRQERATRAKLA